MAFLGSDFKMVCTAQRKVTESRTSAASVSNWKVFGKGERKEEP